MLLPGPAPHRRPGTPLGGTRSDRRDPGFDSGTIPVIVLHTAGKRTQRRVPRMACWSSCDGCCSDPGEVRARRKRPPPTILEDDTVRRPMPASRGMKIRHPGSKASSPSRGDRPPKLPSSLAPNSHGPSKGSSFRPSALDVGGSTAASIYRPRGVLPSGRRHRGPSSGQPRGGASASPSSSTTAAE